MSYLQRFRDMEAQGVDILALLPETNPRHTRLETLSRLLGPLNQDYHADRSNCSPMSATIRSGPETFGAASFSTKRRWSALSDARWGCGWLRPITSFMTGRFWKLPD